MDSTVERSFSPGIREYSMGRRRSFSSRPIGCFAIIGCCILVAGIGMVLWESRSRPKLELGNWYAVMRTLGSTFVSLGLFVFLVSTILMCETVLTERSAHRSTDEEFGALRDDMENSRDYGTRWEPPKKDEFFAQSSETPEVKTRGMVRCVSDSHFVGQDRRTRDLAHHWGSEEFRSDARSAARTLPSSPTHQSTWAPVYDRPTPVHKKGKHRKQKSKTFKSGGVSSSWTYSGNDYPDEKMHKPRLRVSVSEEAIEDNSSNDSPDSGRPGSDFSVNRSNAELLTLLVEKGILNSEDFRQYFTVCAPSGTQLERPKDSPKYSKLINKEEDSDMAIAGHSRPGLLRQRNVEQIHHTLPSKTLTKRSEKVEIPFQKTSPFAGSAGIWDRHVPSRALFTIGERIRTSSTSDWRTESDAGQLDSGIATASLNLTSQLSNSLPHLHGQIDFPRNSSETIVEDLQAFVSASWSENNVTRQPHFTTSESRFDEVLPFEQATHEHVLVPTSQVNGHAEDSPIIDDLTPDSASPITSEKNYQKNL